MNPLSVTQIGFLFVWTDRTYYYFCPVNLLTGTNTKHEKVLLQ
jgi:hypothetical protein